MWRIMKKIKGILEENREENGLLLRLFIVL